MGNKVIRGILRRLHLRETWGIFFCLGIVMMNFPFIHIFHSPHFILGIPVLYIYLMGGWVVSIGVIFLFVKAFDTQKDEDGRGH